MSVTPIAVARLAADHLWQSTVFAAAIWLLTLLFRRQRAAIRHGLWVAASIKFLVPFAALIALGQSIGWTRAPLPAPQMRLAVDVAAQPFSPLPSAASLATSASRAAADNPWLDPTVERGVLVASGWTWIIGAFVLLLRWTRRWLHLRRLIAGGTPILNGREVENLERATRACGAAYGSEDPPVRIVAVHSTIEPGVVGVFRPVLLWPATISARLSDEQIAAIFTHELAHVQRRDNLWAAVHMAVEAICWFHPLVWWMRARLLDERERACDEAVLRGGRAPQPYAESILRTCEFYLESPLPCVTGVTGADLKRRIETIMRNRPAETLGRARAALLSVCALAAIAAPIGVGVMRGPRLLAAQAPAGSGARFDVVSIKRNPDATGGTTRSPAGRYTATGISLRMLIRNAYGLLDSQIAGGPELATATYMAAAKFDITATYSGEATPQQRGEMMRNMLADRFKLVTHTEMREMPVYVLTRLRPDGFGPHLKPAEDAACSSPKAQAERQAARQGGPPGRGQGPNCGALMFGPGQYQARSSSITQLVNSLSNQTPLTGIDRLVLDRTGINPADRFDYELKWRRQPLPAGVVLPPGVTPPAIDPDAPDLFTALQEQLGLKLESQRAPIEVLIVDSAAMPAEN